MKEKKFTLLQKAIIALIIILLPIAVTFLRGYYQNKEHLVSHILRDITFVAEAYEGQVYLFLEMTTRRAEDFSSDGFIRDGLAKIVKGDTAAAATVSDHLIRNKKSLDKTIHDIYVTGLNGLVVSSTEPRAIGTDISSMDYFKEGRTTHSVVETIDIHGMPAIAASVPLTDRKTGESIGVLTNFILLTELNKLLTGDMILEYGALTQHEGKRQTFDAYLVNNKKFFITESNQIDDPPVDYVVDTNPVRACLEGSVEVTDVYVGLAGKEVIGASMCLPQFGWTLLLEMDAYVETASIREMFRDAVITGLIVIGLIGWLFFLFLRNIIRPLETIANAAEMVGRGDYDIHIPVRTTDEIGVLAYTINDMAKDIGESTTALVESEARLSDAQRMAHFGNWYWDIKNDELHWSDEIYRMFGYEPHEFIGTYERFMSSVHPDDRALVKGAVEKSLSEQVPYSIDHRIICEDGTERIVHEEGEAVFDEAGKPESMLGTVQDITDRRRAEYEMKKLSTIIDNSINAVFITDRDGLIEYVNPVFESLTGYTFSEAEGKNPSILSSGETPDSEYEDLWNTILSGRTWRGVFKNKKKGGDNYWASGIITPIKADSGEITHFLAVQEDVTERMQSEEVMEYMAHHDELTGLYNRFRFINMVGSWIGKLEEEGGKKAVMLLLDVDQFKMINNTYGHGLGDELLARIGVLLEETISSVESSMIVSDDASDSAILSRLSGDEFAMFLPTLDEATAKKAAEIFRKAVEEFTPREVSEHFTASIGISLYPDHGVNVRQLISRADASMFRAKEMGRNRCHLYSPDDRIVEEMQSRLKWKERVIEAMEKDRLEPWFQPILNFETGEITHYEALARMYGDEGEIILPGKFIEVAERFGLISELNQIITEKAVRLLKEINETDPQMKVAINLSGRLIGDEDVFIFLEKLIKETAVDPKNIIFEITETAAVRDLTKAVVFVDQLKEIGCSFALDDFGVGFTSFLYLRDLNVDYIKIDGSFIRKLHTNDKDQLFVKALADIARGMKIKTIAEFVENEEIFEILRYLGVDYAQGYFVGRPAPFKDIKCLKGKLS